MTRLFALALLLAASIPLRAAPLDTAFTYQGELLQSGVPANGSYDFLFRLYDAAAGGALVGTVMSANDLAVDGGLFAAELSPGPVLASDRQLWLEIGVRLGASSGPYTTLAPRQKLTLAPAAGYALGAAVADSALSLAEHNVLRVGKSGAQYASVADALQAVTSPGPTNRWLILVGPGEFSEAGPLTIPGYVHLRGAGPASTVLRSINTGATVGSSATVILSNNAALSDLRVENTGSGGVAMGVYASAPVGLTTRIHNVHAQASGPSGTGRYGIYLNDAEPTITGSVLRAAGGSLVNAALGVVNASGGFPRPLIEDSRLLGAAPEDALDTCSDASGTGFGIQAMSAAPVVRRSFVCGGHRAFAGLVAGVSRIEGSTLAVGSSAGAFLVETTSSATVLLTHGQASFGSNKHTGSGNLSCALMVGGNGQPLSNGTTVATACN